MTNEFDWTILSFSIIMFTWRRVCACVLACATPCAHTACCPKAVMWSAKPLSERIDYLFCNRNAQRSLIGTHLNPFVSHWEAINCGVHLRVCEYMWGKGCMWVNATNPKWIRMIFEGFQAAPGCRMHVSRLFVISRYTCWRLTVLPGSRTEE